MKRKWLIILVVVLLIGLGSVLFVSGIIQFQRPSSPLIAAGKTVAVVKQPFLRPNWHYGAADVYAGGKMIFSMGENYFLDGGPVFIYPFADGKRFLCDYDDDTSMLDFVVDLGGSNKTAASFTKWPPNDNVMGNYVRTYMASRITNVVFEAKGLVRLPNYAELEEVSSYLNNPDQKSVTTVYFNFLFHKKFVLLDLATNRQSVWPVEK